MRQHVGYWAEALKKGTPSLLWVAGVLTIILGGSVIAVVVFGFRQGLLWGAVFVLLALVFVMAEGAAKMGAERDAALAVTEDADSEPRVVGISVHGGSGNLIAGNRVQISPSDPRRPKD